MQPDGHQPAGDFTLKTMIFTLNLMNFVLNVMHIVLTAAVPRPPRVRTAGLRLGGRTTPEREVRLRCRLHRQPPAEGGAHPGGAQAPCACGLNDGRGRPSGSVASHHMRPLTAPVGAGGEEGIKHDEFAFKMMSLYFK